MKICPKCRGENKNSDNFCVKCGADIKEAMYLAPQTLKIMNHDYGEKRIGFLNGMVAVVCTVMGLAGFIGGIALISEVDALAGIITMLAAALLTALTYMLLSSLVYIYSNLVIIARNSQIQATHIEVQTKQLNQLIKMQEQMLSGSDKGEKK